MELLNHESLYYSIDINNINSKIAGFDLDYTLIKPKSNRRFPKDENDWKFLFGKDTKEKLIEVSKTHRIVIFTNQKGISKGKLTVDELQNKLNNFFKELNINADVLISTKNDFYRKPLTGMWDFYKKTRKNKISKKNSFYVGDAAGRIYSEKLSNSKFRKDHSADDKYFAHNIKLNFFTPEEFFNININTDEYIVKEFDLENQSSGQININTSRNMILFVGAPASGKTKLYKDKFSDYEHINMDTLKTKAKCLKSTENAMKYQKNIVIDNTNANYESRKIYLDLAKKYNYNKYIINFKTNRKINNYLNYYRVQKSKGKINLIPDVAYNVYYKKFEEPVSSEGIVINYSDFLIDEKYIF